LPFHKADIKSTWANIDKAGSQLDWQPQVTLDAGLEACVRWHHKNKPWSAEVVLP